MTHSTGPDYLVELLKTTARAWAFSPRLSDGESVSSQVRNVYETY
ncbi:MAG: hypothetical protein AAF610_08605 [Pseudomonadota bacterium]